MEFEFLKGFENLYKINKNGEIFSCHYQKIMEPQITTDGYYYVHLRDANKKRTKQRIHRLLALQYIENIDNKETVDHIDRNRTNNDLSNLRWCTRKEQNHNKKNNLTNLTEEELEERKKKIREYKRLWAEKNNRLKGIKPRGERKTNKEYYEAQRIKKGITPRKFKKDMTEEELEERRIKDREYKKIWMRNKRKANIA